MDNEDQIRANKIMTPRPGMSTRIDRSEELKIETAVRSGGGRKVGETLNFGIPENLPRCEVGEESWSEVRGWRGVVVAGFGADRRGVGDGERWDVREVEC